MPLQTTHHASTKTGLKKPQLLVLAMLGLILFGLLFRHPASAPVATPSKPAIPTDFNKHAYSTTDPSSIWVIVNKQHALKPVSYTPDLVVPNVPLKGGPAAENMHVARVMAGALQQLFAGANAAGYHLMLSSGYRSYTYQVTVYNRIVASQGQNSADEQSARPGHSEHQTGLAADIAPVSRQCDLSKCFGQTAEGQWVADNAYKYGFIVRYPADKVAVTGYEYEPWHLRYIGLELSTEMHKQHATTLEEFFAVSGGAKY